MKTISYDFSRCAPLLCYELLLILAPCYGLLLFLGCPFDRLVTIDFSYHYFLICFRLLNMMRSDLFSLLNDIRQSSLLLLPKFLQGAIFISNRPTNKMVRIDEGKVQW